MAKLNIGKNATNNNESANVQNNAQVNNANAVAESPMMRQFKQLKEKHPNALLLFRCGDFYEAYEDDAKSASEVLGITLTKSTKTGVQMAGFPYHALDTYLPKLIKAGHRVAICDQLEAPSTSPRGEQTTEAPSNSPRGEQEEQQPAPKKVTLKKKTPQPKSEKSVDVSTPLPTGEGQGERLPQVSFSTYTTKKGNTAPQIIGFGGENDPRWQSHKDKGHKWCSTAWKKDLSGNKVYCLLFGVRYMEVAKALCEAYNSGDAKAIEKAEAACQAEHEQSQAEGKARWAAKKAEWDAKKAASQNEKRKVKSEEPAPAKQGYDDKDVAEMLQAIMAGGDIPENIKRLMKAA